MVTQRVFATVSFCLLLAGCSVPDDTASSGSGTANVDGTPVTAETYTITLTEFAGHSSPQLTQSEDFTLPTVRNGTAFTFIQKVEGSLVRNSTHIGGHYGPDPDPTAASPGGCTHVSGNLPGTYTITCQALATPGLYHFRGHAQITQGEAKVNWWSADFRFRIT